MKTLNPEELIDPGSCISVEEEYVLKANLSVASCKIPFTVSDCSQHPIGETSKDNQFLDVHLGLKEDLFAAAFKINMVIKMQKMMILLVYLIFSSFIRHFTRYIFFNKVNFVDYHYRSCRYNAEETSVGLLC